MTVAAWSARALHTSLAEQSKRTNGLADLPERFQCRLADTVRLPWVLTTDVDHLIPGADAAPQGAEEAELGRRFRSAQVLANDDLHIRQLVLETMMLVRPPDWLFQGDVADRIGTDDELAVARGTS